MRGQRVTRPEKHRCRQGSTESRSRRRRAIGCAGCRPRERAEHPAWRPPHWAVRCAHGVGCSTSISALHLRRCRISHPGGTAELAAKPKTGCRADQKRLADRINGSPNAHARAVIGSAHEWNQVTPSDDDTEPAIERAFKFPGGVRSGQIRDRRDQAVKNGRWYFARRATAGRSALFAKIGWGDLSFVDLDALAVRLGSDETFVALP